MIWLLNVGVGSAREVLAGPPSVGTASAEVGVAIITWPLDVGVDLAREVLAGPPSVGTASAEVVVWSGLRQIRGPVVASVQSPNVHLNPSTMSPTTDSMSSKMVPFSMLLKILTTRLTPPSAASRSVCGSLRKVSNAFLRVFTASFGRSEITDGTSPFWSCSTKFFASSGLLSKD
jgi:hypothetical protein